MARKIIGAAFISLDGVIQGPGGPEEDPTGGFRFGGWTAGFWDESLSEVIDPLFESEYDLLLGRRTYDIFAAYWPYNQDVAIGATFQRIDKFVATHSEAPLEWENSHRLQGDLPAAIAELKANAGRDLLIQGSSTLYPQLLGAGLIDQLKLMTFPLVLGRGKRLFGDGTPPGALRLVDHAVSDKGVIVSTYQPAGEVPTGTFATKEPSEAELRRREAMAQGTW